MPNGLWRHLITIEIISEQFNKMKQSQKEKFLVGTKAISGDK